MLLAMSEPGTTPSTSHLDDFNHLNLKIDIAMKRISVRVSIPRPGEVIVPPSHCILLLVQAIIGPSRTVTIMDSEQSMVGIMQHAGDSYSLESGLVARVEACASAALVCYEIPRGSFHLLAELSIQRSIATFEVSHVVIDSMLHLLSRSIRPLLLSRNEISTAFAGYFLLSLCGHLADRYGLQEVQAKTKAGGLSPRNLRLVEETLNRSGDWNVTLGSLAKACQLSKGHFARAFQETFGVPFQTYYRDLRHKSAMRLLAESDLLIREIALRIGYADQASFTESFKRDVGIPPGRYRRQHSQMTATETDTLISY